LDYATKVWAVKFLTDSDIKVIGNLIKFSLTFNKGAAFSLATSKTIFLSSFAICVGAAIIYFGRKTESSKWAVALGLVLGGICGNLADRIFRAPGGLQGAVVDWIKFAHWPTFNIADSSVVLGGACLLYLQMRKIPYRNNISGSAN
jgi:signal peptidase II